MARSRSIVVRLKAEISGFQSAMGQASRSLSDFEREQQKMGGAATTTLGRLAQSAKINEREWTNVGTSLAVVGGAVTGLGVAALRTGIDYNSLRQSATKALEGITGSTQGAAEQMQRLDNFGQNSWLMRDVLIRAQQDMTGFGIETGKVIPYMDALAEAVAGTTGSQQNFEELARLMGQIQSQGKITARELNQFGLRGIDAAQLIGDAMGKTANQIRDEITSGTLDAGDALDALAEGMATNFEGSSDRLRDTWQGALDDVMAAWRDIGAALAAPLVDPEGGGMLVDFMNSLADSMRGFRDAPSWLTGTIAAITGLTGAAALGGGALLLAAPRFFRFKEDLQTLANIHPSVGRLSGALGTLGKTVGVTAAALVGLSIVRDIAANTRDAVGGVDSFTNALNRLEVAGDSTSLDDLFTFDGLEQGIPVVEGFADALGTAFPEIDGWMAETGHNIGLFNADVLSMPGPLKDALESFQVLDSGLANMDLDDAATHMQNLKEQAEAAGRQDFSTWEGLSEIFPQYAAAVEAAATATGEYVPDAELLEIALGNIAPPAEEAAGASDELAGSLAGVGVSAGESADAMDNWIAKMAEAGGSFGGILDAFDAVIEKQGETRASTAQTMEQWIEQMQKQREATENWRDNIKTAMDQISESVDEGAQEAHLAFVREMIEAGEGGAEALQTFVDGTPEQRQALIDEWLGTGEAITEATQEGLEPIEIDADTEPALQSHSDFLAYALGTPATTDIDADTEPALQSHSDFLAYALGTPATTDVDADTSPAVEETGRLYSTIEGTTTDTNVDANTGPADATYDFLTGTWNSTTTDTHLDANTGPAMGSYDALTGTWSGSTTDTNLDANTGPADGSFNSATSGWRGTTTTTKIDADTSPASRAWNSFKSTVGSITTSIIARVTGGNYHGGFVNPGRYEGGTVLPGRQAGGRVPGPRAGRDNILWPLHSGGQILSQPLEGGEFVVRSAQVPNYTQELSAMNNGTFPTGVMERLYSSNAGPSSVTVSVPPVDTAAIGAAVATAIRSYQPVVNIGDRQFYGKMQEVSQQFGNRF